MKGVASCVTVKVHCSLNHLWGNTDCKLQDANGGLGMRPGRMEESA